MSGTASRRGLIGSGVAMLVLAATAAGEAKATELDGDILRASTEFHALQERVDRLCAEWEVAAVRPNFGRDDDQAFSGRLDELAEAQCARCDVATYTAARTPEGIRAKARILFRELDTSNTNGEAFEDGRYALAWSLVCDLLGEEAWS